MENIRIKVVTFRKDTFVGKAAAVDIMKITCIWKKYTAATQIIAMVGPLNQI